MVLREPVTTRGLQSGERKIWLLSGLLFAVAGAYAAGVIFRDSEDFSPLVDGVLGLLTMWLPAAVGWLIVYRTKGRRPDIMLSVGALSFHAAGDAYYVLQSAAGEDVPLPSPADVGYIGFYLLMLAALASIVRDRLREMTWPVLLDSALGALGAAAVLAVVLDPILNSALDGPRSLAAALGAAYPLLDLLLVAAVIGIAATAGRAIGEGWALLVLGLITYAGADMVYALLELNDLYVVGTPLDAAWAAGTALVGSWTVFQGRPGGGGAKAAGE
ncbi:hypothetical protein [Arthrobacter sp. CG_A4]|uniref:hypothetical protein n=1 Tax=Arthrobacter sp. CG_A4 TaxID=3071706 RepID=UPI002E08304B|nr:hypothetical protein [Arthrobacter sp. CG_A4]